MRCLFSLYVNHIILLTHFFLISAADSRSINSILRKKKAKFDSSLAEHNSDNKK